MSCDVPTNPEARIARDTHPCPAKSSTKSRSTDWGMELLFAKRITTNISAAGEPHFLISITTMFPHKNGRKVLFFFMEYQFPSHIYIYRLEIQVCKISRLKMYFQHSVSQSCCRTEDLNVLRKFISQQSKDIWS